ncbi:MAG: TolC family protein [Phycisphaerae bacterium]|nr:TolC family protein [Phycisphaerae bacterium]
MAAIRGRMLLDKVASGPDLCTTMCRFTVLSSAVLLGVALAGCQEWFVRDADRQVYRLIADRQADALGETHSADLGPEDGHAESPGAMYDLVPHPVDSEVPEAFRTRVGSASATTQPATTQPASERRILTLQDAVAYAMRHSREFQSEKEDLYLAALALTLERHLWTPQFFGEVSYEYANYGQVRDFDHAMTAVAQLGASQRLPYGGEVTAQIVHSLMRDLGAHITSGETGQVILSADIPLLRGAGKAARESRYQAERDLIYAARRFERFRRAFLVEVASSYFDVLALKAGIENARASEAALAADKERSEGLAATERVLQVDVDRAQVEYLLARNDAINSEASYESALDRFKILIGMPTTESIDAVEPDFEVMAPAVSEETAIETALRCRLDLLNDQDAVDDARRGVQVARNNLLPDLDFRGSVALDSDPNRKNSASYNTERATWRGEVAMEIPLNRVAERNDYRSSIIYLRRAERNFDRRCDEVRMDVRDAFRGIEQARLSLQIQAENIKINDFRKQQAEALLDRGMLTSNRDKIEAETSWREAKNRYAQAEANYRTAILAFLRDTGTLRVTDDGQLATFEDTAAADAKANAEPPADRS